MDPPSAVTTCQRVAFYFTIWAVSLLVVVYLVPRDVKDKVDLAYNVVWFPFVAYMLFTCGSAFIELKSSL